MEVNRLEGAHDLGHDRKELGQDRRVCVDGGLRVVLLNALKNLGRIHDVGAIRALDGRDGPCACGWVGRDAEGC